MSGKAKMDKNGYAVIPFLIRPDNKTEGTEKFNFSFYKDKNFKKKYSSFSLDILDDSVETAKNKPTLSPAPLNKQPVGVVRQIRGRGSQLPQADQSYRKTNPREPELTPIAQPELLFTSKLLAMASTRMISILITHEQMGK